jgi:polyisoprenoid-binding protein YceI
LTDSMKFRHAFISLGVSHVVAMTSVYPRSRKVAPASNTRYNHCDRNELWIHAGTGRRSTKGACTMSDLKELTPGVWNVDPVHSSVGFVARHLMVSKVRGTFGKFEGTITVAEDPLKSKVEATVDMASVSTGDETREGHLKSPDFFDVENHPTMTLVSTGIEKDDDDDDVYILHTNLTIRGVTKPVDFELEFEGVSGDPWGGTRAGFSAEAEISRKQWGLEWNVALETGGVMLGDKVKIVLDIQAVKA